jgi:LPS-assembly lipoprotein
MTRNPFAATSTPGWRVLTIAFAAIFAATLASCGFHLRGEATYTFTSMFLNSNPSQPITIDLRRAIEGSGGTKLVTDPLQAEVTLEVQPPEDTKQIQSLSSGGKVAEYLLTKRVLFRVHDKDGNEWLPTSEVIARRSYTYSDSEALAKETEEQRLWKEMQTDAVQQVVRRLQAAKKPAA